ncbi:MAG: slipin family protein [Deltaproteobacteria bacterium]|nr:slipin family protein [Deltaproteobacteria bacterium]
MSPWLIFVGVVTLLFISGVRIFYEYERGVVFRLGRLSAMKGAGFRWIIPGVDRVVRVDLRIVTMDVPSQDVITRDNVTIKVNAVVYFRVLDPNKATIAVNNYLYATSQLAQTTLRSVLGESELDELLTSRETINHKLQEILDRQTDAWGIKISQVEVKHIDLPQEMQRAMARQAEAERERRGKVIAAEGEYQAAERLNDAAMIMSKNPITIQLRYLQTLGEIASETNSVTLFPIPIDIIQGFLDMKKNIGA